MAINKRKILESAQKHLQRGALDKALEDYRILLKADPHDSNVLLKIGDLHLKQGKRDEAINAYLRVAQQFTREGFDAKAVALYKQISRLDPKRQDVAVPLAELYARLGLVSDAIAALQGAADSAYRAGDKDGALELLRRMAALDPANTLNRLKVAELLAQEGRRDEALCEYDAVAEELARRGEDEERIRVLERVLAVDARRSEALLEVARAKLRTEQFAAARKLAERLLELQADDVEGREIVAKALHGEGHTERAREAFRELAELFRLRGDEARARDLMQRFGGLEALAPEDSDAPVEGELPLLDLGDEEGGDDFLLDEELPPPRAAAAPPARAAAASPARTVATPAGSSPAAPPPVRAASAPPARVAAAAPVREAAAPAAAAAPPAPATARATEGDSNDAEQLLAEAAVYLRYGKHERAVSALRAVLAQAPDHAQALESLGEALAALGETAHAVTALQRAAESVRGGSDPAALERIRERLARLDAEAAAALTMAEPAHELSGVEIDLDLDGELGAVEEPTLAASGDLDSLSLDLEGLDLAAETPDADADAPATAAPAAALLEPAAQAPAAEAVPEEVTATTPGRVAADLEEAEFYFEQGLQEEARTLYDRILAAAPNHPQAMLRLGELAARGAAPAPMAANTFAPAPAPAAEAARTPAAVAAPVAASPPAAASADEEPSFELDLDEDTPPPAPEPVPPPRIAEAEITRPGLAAAPPAPAGDFDLAAELSGAIGGEEPSLRTLAGTEEEGFEQVFHAFKSGIERELGDGDHEARYDLGIAYKEMGLLEDAIAAFAIAMRAPARQLACLHMLGLCALDLGRPHDATAHLEQALSLPGLPDDQRVPLRYDLGRAYAASGDRARARAAFEDVRASDPSFGDVARELAALEAAPEPSTSGEEDGEAYESFDDLLSDAAPVAAAAAPTRYESFDDLFAEEPPEPEAPADSAEARQEAIELEAPEHSAEAPEAEAPSDSAEVPEAEAPSDSAEPLEIEESAESQPRAAEPPDVPAAAPSAAKKRRKISFV